MVTRFSNEQWSIIATNAITMEIGMKKLSGKVFFKYELVVKTLVHLYEA